MNTLKTSIHQHINTMSKVVLSRVLAISLIVCSTSLAAQNNASRSTEIDVSPEFQFRTFHSVTLDLSVSDKQGTGMAGEVIRVYAVEDGVENISDPRLADRELILMTRTDAVGRVYLTPTRYKRGL